jgi:peroxiredoxin
MLNVGELAPDFELPDVHGVVHTLPEMLGRGPLLLAFFKISCPVCQYTMPFLERISVNGRLHVYGVSQDEKQSTVGFLGRFGLNFPTLLDDARHYAVSNAYKLTNVPTMYLVEKDNTITWASTGFHKKDLSDLGLRATTEIFRPDDRVPEWKPG